MAQQDFRLEDAATKSYTGTNNDNFIQRNDHGQICTKLAYTHLFHISLWVVWFDITLPVPLVPNEFIGSWVTLESPVAVIKAWSRHLARPVLATLLLSGRMDAVLK